MESIIQQLIDKDEILFILAITTMVVLIVSIKAFTRMIARLANERTRREIAAYIAEGSMTPEQGERLLAAGRRNNGIDGCG